MRDVLAELLTKTPAKKDAFRGGDAMTKQGFKTGYHEAFLTTDMAYHLSQRTPGGNGLSVMPGYHSSQVKTHAIQEKNVESVLSAGDGARFDTTRTILSGPNGTVAGHPGSEVGQTNKNLAHDLLREQSIRVLKDPQMTPAAIGVVSAATSIYSMAPGVLASKAEGAHNLKDGAAKDTWEVDRNEAKLRLAASNASLSPPEQDSVRQHMQRFVTEVGGNRGLLGASPSSPLRVTSRKTMSNAIAGGDYEFPTNVPSPSKLPPSTTDPRMTNLYVTETLRSTKW